MATSKKTKSVKSDSIIHQSFQFLKANWIIVVFICIVGFTLLVALNKLASSEDEYVYAKVKVSQGLWWANTQRPNLWLAQSIKPGDIEKSLTGKPTIEVLSVRTYPWWNSDQYDVYLTLKLTASKSERTGKYSFKRSTIGVGAPIDLEFPQAQFSATIMDLSEQPFVEKRVEKIVSLSKNFAYPWEYDAIKIGDTYDDGTDIVFEVLDKSRSLGSMLAKDQFDQYPGISDLRDIISLQARMKLKEQDEGVYIFGEEQIVRPGKEIIISTNLFEVTEYLVTAIEDVPKDQTP